MQKEEKGTYKLSTPHTPKHHPLAHPRRCRRLIFSGLSFDDDLSSGVFVAVELELTITFPRPNPSRLPVCSFM